MSSTTFNWDDPLLLEEQLESQERQIRDSARAYCQEKLMPRILEAHRHEHFDPEILSEMGQLGFLSATLSPELGGSGAGYVSYGLIAREVERVDSSYRSAMSVQSSLVLYPIATYGTDALHKKYLPGLIAGTSIGVLV
jgi:glutaryl-CoA dehydrogenase